ncbi:hypothetical protein N9910_01265 [bacterium]|nr:hypothetical protein [Akkermansiaceae bacterium]MDB4271131.1 hypothetical protein [bacterium]MDB4298347.1 hypothetical protein [bacterium]MDB4327686.1 hypothetical protein [bacterium]MDB4378086.1 hypothetical protein [Akkermansiaceae bacterium]
MVEKDSLQHLLKESHRDDLIVLPKKVLRLGAAALIIFFFTGGFTIATMMAGSSDSLWVFGIGAAVALGLGRWNNRIGDRLHQKYETETSRKNS